MNNHQTPIHNASNLKQKLLEALKRETFQERLPLEGTLTPRVSSVVTSVQKTVSKIEYSNEILKEFADNIEYSGIQGEPDLEESSLKADKGSYATKKISKRQLNTSTTKAEPDFKKPLTGSMLGVQQERQDSKERHKTKFDDKLSIRGVDSQKPLTQNYPQQDSGMVSETGISSLSKKTDLLLNKQTTKTDVNLKSVISGGSMADLSGYKDLSKAPVSFEDDDMPMSSIPNESSGFERVHHHQMNPMSSAAQHFMNAHEAHNSDTMDSEFSGNVKTLIRLVSELPEGVTKQTGAQIIRLTMEAMGISMEDVLSEAQSAQSEMLDAVRANIKKIEEYKTVIRKLETDIKYYQGKANELSEIIDLFILSNTSGQKVPSPDDISY